MCTPTAQLTDLAKEPLAKEVGYGIVRIGDLSVYAPDDTPQHKLTMENVVYGGKIASTVQLGPIPIQSTSHLLFKREQCISVSDSHFFATRHTGHADLPFVSQTTTSSCALYLSISISRSLSLPPTPPPFLFFSDSLSLSSTSQAWGVHV
jgi:hypothetical protein